jgi:ribosomal protein RSM22 (predicted rRNA methylase)
MSVPAALAEVLARLDAPPGLAAAVQALSARYRDGVAGTAPAMRDQLERLAYVMVRMPATAAAVSAALAAAQEVTASAFTSHLDLGSGSGAALWAAAERMPGIGRRTAVERDPAAIALAGDLAAGDLAGCTWVEADLRRLPALEVHDLVTASYALNELTAEQGAAVVDRAWALTGGWLVLVEPGTPRGAAVIAAARRRLLAAGAHVVGPCTHAATCPLDGQTPAGAPGWCHFRVRLQRSRLHRNAKGAAIGHEDEPFAWLALSRQPVAVSGARIIAAPRVHKGAAELALCRADGFAAVSVARRERAAYAAASRLGWGDRWLPPA